MSHGPARPTDRAQRYRIGADPSGGVTGGRPTYLGLEPSGTLTFLHEPCGAAAGVGTAVLLCPPFGWEEVCCSRSLRGAATLLARAGHPTARLTLPGTADGAGGPRDGDLVRRWIDAVAAAAAWLRERTDASRCLAFGIGLGGMLAYLAAREHDAIDDLALWAVPDRGRTLLHEGKSLSKVIASDFREDRGRDPAAAGDLDLIGYLMTAETQAALSALELSALALPDCGRRRVLLLSRGALPVDQALQDSLEGQGAEVAVRRTTDYYALMVKPEQSQTPEATVVQVVDWLAQGPAAAESRSALGRRTPPRVRETSELEVAGGVVESPLGYSGSHGEVFGIVSRDPTAGPAPLALLLLGAGALPHTGPNRAWVEVGRRWAARGIPTVRLDLAGIGEAGSEDPEVLTDDSMHESWRIDDVRGVLDQLQAAGTAERFVLGGLCSGANCSLHGALADSRVCGLLLINLFVVTWSGELITERSRRAAIADGLPNAGIHSLDCSAERRQGADAIAAFDQLRERGTEVLLLFGEQEALYQEFARQGLLDQLDRWPNLRLERIPSRDQMFRAQWLQRHVHERVDEALERMLARLPAGADWKGLIEEPSA
jgi:alpha-beta hydrolase superfamily lysophospholipase